MSQVIEGSLDAHGLKFAIIVARFNSFITDRLVSGACDALSRSGANVEDIEIVKVPGAWELPLATQAVAGQKRHDGIIALGAVIRGATPHFDYVAGHAASGLAHAQTQTDIPIAFGVLTTNNVEEAVDRAGAKAGNKGFDAAMTVIEMVNLLKKLRAPK